MDLAEASCLLVAKILAADGIMAAPEKEFLAATMRTLSLAEEAQARVFDLRGLDEAAAFVRDQSVEVRRDVMDRLLEAALADGRLSPHELTTMKRLAESLAID